MDWSLRDLFLAYIAKVKAIARENYHIDVLVWAIHAPYDKRRRKPPEIPQVLR